MNGKVIVDLIRSKQLFLLIKLSRLLTPFYRLNYIASLFSNGYLKLLADKPMTLDELAGRQGIKQENKDALEAWLQVGIAIKEIGFNGKKYMLKGLSKRLARQNDDALFAIVQEVTSLHYKLINDTPAKLQKGELWTLNDQDGEVIARSSRVVEPFQRQVINSEFPENGPVKLLEIGCGSGIYIR